MNEVIVVVNNAPPVPAPTTLIVFPTSPDVNVKPEVVSVVVVADILKSAVTNSWCFLTKYKVVVKGWSPIIVPFIEVIVLLCVMDKPKPLIPPNPIAGTLVADVE